MSKIGREEGGSGSKAFTLLELLIVILLLSLMAMMVATTISKRKKTRNITNISQLKSLRSSLPSGRGELVCLDGCTHCFLQDAEKKEHPLSQGFKGLKAYILDRRGDAHTPEFGRYEDHPVCLRFRFRRNGSTSQMILERKGVFYFVPAYFGKVRSFPSLEEARAYWLRNRELLQNRWDYY
ncbi:prepilin-type N-terminal cleavage/methylation domain-containing protein [Thermococcus sp.]|uniref:prepilin-type N-terminal cleavage/methylation domain-containing protein n=1 Tax=Thermococcus sp. TaxID=35749 RepID=UPI00345D9B91